MLIWTDVLDFVMSGWFVSHQITYVFIQMFLFTSYMSLSFLWWPANCWLVLYKMLFIMKFWLSVCFVQLLQDLSMRTFARCNNIFVRINRMSPGEDCNVNLCNSLCVPEGEESDLIICSYSWNNLFSVIYGMWLKCVMFFF